jgi:hypothetical protein
MSLMFRIILLLWSSLSLPLYQQASTSSCPSLLGEVVFRLIYILFAMRRLFCWCFGPPILLSRDELSKVHFTSIGEVAQLVLVTLVTRCGCYDHSWDNFVQKETVVEDLIHAIVPER